MDAAQLKERLAREALTVARELFPQGKLAGHEWCVGGLDGHAGNSLKIVVSGAKAGIWADFGAGGTEKGDLLDLWAQARGIDLSQAMEEVRQRYGIQKPVVRQATKKKAYDRPKKPATVPLAGTEVERYLKTERAIYPDTARAWGVRQADSWEGKNKEGKTFQLPGPWIVFPYLRPNDRGSNDLINVKWLHLKRDADGKKRTTQAPNAEYSLWGWHMHRPGCRRAVILEGEMEPMTVWQCLKELGRQGDYSCFSTPAGAGTGHKHDWIENDWDRLEEFDDIVILMDMDEEGEAATKDIAARLGLHRCRRGTIPHKDPNDCVAKFGMTPAELIAHIDGAPAMSPPELRGAKDFVEEVIEKFYPTKTTAHGIALPWAKAGQLRLRMGEFTLVTGLSGDGKSILLNQVMLHANDQGYKGMIASMEMTAADTLQRATKQANRAYSPPVEDIRRFHDWLDGRLWVFNVKGSTDSKTLLQNMLYARRRYGCVLFIIDSLMRCGIGFEEYEKQDQFVKDLCAFCEQEQVHVILVAHSRKQKEDYKPLNKASIKGSGGITDNAFNVVIITRNMAKERKIEALSETAGDARDSKMADLIEKPDATFGCDKQRGDLSWVGTVPLWYDKRSCLYRDDRLGEAPILLTYKPANSNDAPSLEVPDDLAALWDESAAS